jgi:hypothetical protein
MSKLSVHLFEFVEYIIHIIWNVNFVNSEFLRVEYVGLVIYATFGI